ncbi:MAG: 3-deoxy-D-manno-octulosonic acid kinase, partial [Pseudomonadota bacterium]
MTRPVEVSGSSETPRVVSEGDAHVLCIEPTGAGAFEPASWPQASAASGGRGNAWFVSDGEQQLVLRYYMRGGKAALVSRDRYLFTGLARTRSFREFRMLLDLYRAGLPVPEPVAALAQPGGRTYRAALLTRAIEGASSLGDRLAADDLSEPAMAAVGTCIRRFHDAGAWHADLNANNVLFDRQGHVYLIDFDRGRFRDGRGWCDGNLARLRRSL